ncbi:MAG: FAD-dependent oxidoreductase [Pleurocapsa sp. MO_226.B13]|nr:FAD-dependent oxidoreductase [Pleurocapsa sp. MO_226.B13]
MSKNKFDLNTKICIVGAGAAGLSTAYFLQKKGYKNITILEKEKQAGGKCRTIFYENRSYELGAALITVNYRITLEILKELGLKTKPFLNQYTILLDNKGVEIKYDLSHKLKYLWELLGYLSSVYLKNRSIYTPGLSNISKEYYENCNIFCRKNNLLNFASKIDLICSAYGYGYFDTVPVAYYIKYLNYMPLVRSIFTKNYGGKFIAEGTETIWQEMAKKFNVLYEQKITNIERNKQIHIHTQKDKFEIDKLILACSLEDSLDFIDKTYAEEELFSKIIYNYYYTFAFIIKKYPFDYKNRKVLRGYFPDNINKESQGKIMCFYRRYLDSDLCTFYLIANQNYDEQELKSDVKNQLGKKGFIVDREYTSVKWKYFPHVSSEELRNGFYQKLEGIQGQNNTYLTGEIMNFSCVEAVCEYSNYLINQYF